MVAIIVRSASNQMLSSKPTRTPPPEMRAIIFIVNWVSPTPAADQIAPIRKFLDHESQVKQCCLGTGDIAQDKVEIVRRFDEALLDQVVRIVDHAQVKRPPSQA